MQESLYKHVLPAFKAKAKENELVILDICFGLGFNTLATLYYVKQQNLSTKLNIYSPELDSKLIESLNNFTYPDEFLFLKEIISALINNHVYSEDGLHIELHLGDAREYILKFEENTFDIVYQDAFSPSVNPLLWTKEYFSDIARIIKEDGILTTYSTAFKTRLALYENSFNLYTNSGENFRTATLASLSKIDSVEAVNMEHKIACNKNVDSLRD